MRSTHYGHSPAGYLETPTAAPLGIVEMMPGARNLMDYAGVIAGEKVLVLTEHSVDPVVVQALTAAAAYRGANVSVLSVEPFSVGGSDTGVPGAESIAAAAHGSADVVISCTWYSEVHCEPMFFSQVAKKQKRFVSLHMAALGASLATGARLAPEIYYAILQATLPIVNSGADLRLTTEHGTDLTFSNITLTPDEGPLRAGAWRPFPYGGVNFYPGDTNGVFVVEESAVTGIPDEKLEVELKDNIVTDIRGGVAAEELRRFGPRGYYMRHALIGLNPKVRLAGGTQFEREKHAGAFYLGIDGLSEDGTPDPSGPGYAHCDCQFDTPTVTVGETLLVDKGRLTTLDDPDVRAAAAKFGPPELLLDDNARLAIPRRFAGFAL